MAEIPSGSGRMSAVRRCIGIGFMCLGDPFQLLLEYLRRAGLAGEEFLVALEDCRTNLWIAYLAGVLQLVGCELRDDGDAPVRNLELNPLTRFDAGLAANALGHGDFGFGFERDGHRGGYRSQRDQLSSSR